MAFKDPDRDIKYKNDWQKQNKDRIVLLVPKGEKEELQVIADLAGQSLNAWINEAIQDKLNKISRD